MRNLFLLFLLSLSFSAFSQPFVKQTQHYINSSFQAGSTFIPQYTFKETTGGLAAVQIDTAWSGGNRQIIDLIRINGSGDTLWTKRNILDTVSDGLSCSVVQLSDGNYMVSGACHTVSNFQCEAYYEIKINPSGTVLSKLRSDCYPANYGSLLKKIVPCNNGGFYSIYAWDSAYLDTSAILNDTAEIRMYVERFDSSNVRMWRDSFVCKWLYMNTNFSPAPNACCLSNLDVNSAVATYDNGIAYVKYYDTFFVSKYYTNGYLVPSNRNVSTVFEKVNLNGSIVWSRNLNSALNLPAWEYPNLFNLSPTSDSGFIASVDIVDSNLNYLPTYYFIKFNSNGYITDSFSYNPNQKWYGWGYQNSNGHFVFPSYIMTDSVNSQYISGVTEYDKHLNFISFNLYPFDISFLSYTYPIANSIGGGFCAWPVDTFDGTAMHDFIAMMNYDSLFRIYPSSVSGDMVQDNNSNCITNSGDYKLPYVPVKLHDLAGPDYYAFTGADGHYTASMPAATYWETHQGPLYRAAECPTNGTFYYSFTSASTYTNQVFYDTIVPNSPDISLLMYAGYFVPGFTDHIHLRLSNVGTVSGNTVLKFILDNNVTYSSSIPTPSSVSGDTMSYTFNSFQPDSIKDITITVSVPNTVSAGTNLTFTASAPFTNDLTPANNVDTLSTVVVSSFDPNCKNVNQPLYFDANNEMVFNIEFQNTGNFPAKNVVVIDSMDRHLDFSTFRLISSTTAMPKVKWLEQNVLQFDFDNIYLPDSMSNPLGSKAEFVYAIKPAINTQAGDTINNKAYILFDFNKAVVTNSTLNIVSTKPSSVTKSLLQDNVSIYPNPGNGDFTVSLPHGAQSDWTLTITDVSGRTISSGTYSPQNDHLHFSLDAPAAVYFVHIVNKTSSQSFTKKLILVK